MIVIYNTPILCISPLQVLIIIVELKKMIEKIL